MSKKEELSPRYSEALLTQTKERIPFWSLVGMELIDIRKGWAKTKIPYSQKLTNANGVAHGGVIFSAADSAVGLALLGLVDRHDLITTIEMKINYLKSFDRGEIFAEAKIIFKGSQTAVGEVEVRDSDGNLLAKALSTYAIIKRNS
jgi:acyl-CoA thioesterase